VCSGSAIALVAVSRTVLNVHWMSDVVVGAMIGAATMLLVWTVAPAVLVDRPNPREAAAARAPWEPSAVARTVRRGVLTRAEDA
jgi:membrane-associated phospholipid phosphatase